MGGGVGERNAVLPEVVADGELAAERIATLARAELVEVVVAGLDQDFRAQPFPAMARLMAVAEQVDKLFAICVRCGAYATRSQRLIDGQPASAKTPILVVGGLELYEARCRACYELQ